MRSRAGDYHLVIAHNFLSNISLDGSHSDTKLRVFKPPSGVEGTTAASEDDDESIAVKDFDEERAVLLEARNVCSSAIGGNGGSICTSFNAKNKSTKPSFLKRFGRMISADDVLVEEEQSSVPEGKASTIDSVLSGARLNRRSDSSDQSTLDERTVSPVSWSHFPFLRLLRTSLTKEGRSRSYLCTTSGAPLIVISHFPFQASSTRERPRLRNSRSSIESSERVNQIKTVLSTEELRPFDFKEVKYIYFDQLGSQLRRASVSLSGVAWKSLYNDEAKANDLPTNQHHPSITGSLDGGTRKTDACGDPLNESDSYQLDTDDTRCNDYDPLMLDEVASATRTIIRTNGFIGVTKLFAPPNVAKTMLNNVFAEKFPNIHITYSKMRSIKRDVWQIAKECGIDDCTVAHAYVYFERIAIKGLISKYNRKFVAGIALLVAVKLNDYKKSVIVKVLQCAEDVLRISRREMLAFRITTMLSPPVRSVSSASSHRTSSHETHVLRTGFMVDDLLTIGHTSWFLKARIPVSNIPSPKIFLWVMSNFEQFYDDIKATEQEDSTLTSQQQLDRLLRPGSTYLNLNPFEVLQIDPDCDIDEAKKKFKKLSLLIHPDKNIDDRDRADQAFDIIKKAMKQIENPIELNRCKDCYTEAARSAVYCDVREKKKTQEGDRQYGNRRG
ncbi:hypothetical protein KIN20_034459 [Parelaphostrongylus tenuis]|uniref:J domain-containing protein n=1 Tax=Parelaphostrongylus tenuis TaxID=148309 RepID=A0AAD5RA19_PARTN|nr:hypothetical protein KIN20_034459 [Parelaphostrongylus tenuis]